MTAYEHTAASTRLLDRLRERGWSVATAESLTGGLVASALVEIAGASESLRGGVVAYDTRVKSSLLGVDSGLLEARGAVDPDVATQMARGARRALRADGLDADVGIATTGVAGPAPADGQPVGRVYVAVSTPDGDDVREHDLEGDRDEIRRQAVTWALRLAVDVV